MDINDPVSLVVDGLQETDYPFLSDLVVLERGRAEGLLVDPFGRSGGFGFDLLFRDSLLIFRVKGLCEIEGRPQAQPLFGSLGFRLVLGRFACDPLTSEVTFITEWVCPVKAYAANIEAFLGYWPSLVWSCYTGISEFLAASGELSSMDLTQGVERLAKLGMFIDVPRCSPTTSEIEPAS